MWYAADWICPLSTVCCAGKYNETSSDGKAVRGSSRVLRLIDGMTDLPVHLRGYLATSRCPRCWATTPQASRWTPTPMSPLTPSSRRRKPWGASSPVRYRPFRYPLPLGSALGSEKSSGRKQQLMQAKRPETLRFRVFLARREGFEPPAFWSVGCLKHKSEPFRLRFVLFTAVHSEDLPLFPPSPACSGSVLGQKWVRENFEITKQKLSSVCPI